MSGSAPPAGWGVLELAEEHARTALKAWDDTYSRALYLDRGMALAEATRKLLAELAAERRMRHATESPAPSASAPAVPDETPGSGPAAGAEPTPATETP